jgi:hypothetical protein
VLDTEEQVSRRERALLASVAARESGDWEGAEALSGREGLSGGDDRLIEFARKLSRQPWQMAEPDLDGLRAAGYSETAVAVKKTYPAVPLILAVTPKAWQPSWAGE